MLILKQVSWTLGVESNYLEKSVNMRELILIIFLFFTTITTLLAQEIAPSKNKFGATLSTNIFGVNDDLNHIAVGGGFYFSRKIANKLSIYSELVSSSRNYGDLSIMPGLSGELTTGNVAIYIAPMFDIGKKSNLSLGLVKNYLISSKLKTSTTTKDVKDETTDYSSLFFDFRTNAFKEVVFGIRYEWGLNSMFKTKDRKVTNISFNVFLPLNGKRNQKKDK
jgi:hypothetical protein